MTAILIALAIIAAAFGFGLLFMFKDGYSIWPMFLGVALLLVAVTLLVLGIVTPLSANYDERQCDRFAEATHRETEFRRFSFWTWQCYAKTGDNTWLPIDQLRDVDE